MAEVKLWLPNGLDLTPVMAEAGLDRQVIFGEWLVSEVTRWQMLYKVPAGQFVSLAFTHLESGIPRNLIGPLKRALIPKVLETDGRYWFGPGRPGKCAGYRLAPGVAGKPVPVTRFSISLGQRLADAEERRAAQLEQEAADLDPHLHRLREHVQAARLTDEARADPHPVVEFLTGERSGWFVECAQGRVHHPVTCTPRRLRQYLRLGDQHQPLALVDVSACQPLLLGLLAAQPQQAGTSRSEPEQPADNKQATAGAEPEQQHAEDSTHLFSHLPHACPFVSRCLDGTLYEALAEAMTSISRRQYTREHAKKRWMGVAYGQPGLMGHKLTGRAICKLFPEFFSRVHRLAAGGEHGSLARRMQRLESGLVIRGVVAELFRAHPEVPVVPIHDAILTHAVHAETVRGVFREVFRERLGVTPRLKVERLTPSARPVGGFSPGRSIPVGVACRKTAPARSSG